MTSSTIPLELPERPSGAVPDGTATKRFWTPNDVADATGLSPQAVRGHLREAFPEHENETWWRLDHDEYTRLVAVIHSAQATHPQRPGYAIRQEVGR